MNTIEQSAPQLLHSQHWFDSVIESDPWIVYHATSSANEESIDIHGLHLSHSSVLADAAILASKFFVNTNWTGFADSDSGHVVLLSFSLERSHSSAGRPLYFACYPQRPYLYLMRDFCGGENAHALTKAIPAIIQFASDDTAIDKHLNHLKDRAISKIKTGVPPDCRVVDLSRDWLRKQAQQLALFLDQLNLLRSSHRYGVLYAVRLYPADLNPGKYSWSDGLRIYKNIPPNQIVAKLRVFEEEALAVLGGLNAKPPPINFDTLENSERFELGPLAQSIRLPSAPQPSHSILVNQLLDPAAGTNITLDLIHAYGNNQLRAWAKQHPTLPIDPS